MKGRMIKFSLPVLIGIVLIFISTKRFICTPSGLAPEFKEIKKTEITKFNSDSLWLTMTATADNKNDFKIEIQNLRVNIINQNNSLGYAERKDIWEIGASTTGEIEFNSALDTKKILKIVSDETDSLNLRLIGSAEANLGFVMLPVDIDIEFTVPVKDQISKTVKQDTDSDKIITIISAGIKNLNLGEAIVEVEFSIANPYGIEFSVIEYPSTIFINGNEAGTGNISSTILVKAKGEKSEGSISYKMSNPKTLTSLFGSLFSRKLEYETDGVLLINILGYNINIPYRMKGVLVKI